MAGIFPEQHPEDVLTVVATEPIKQFTFVDVQSGRVGTSATQQLGIAQHDALPSEAVTVATGGLCAVRVQSGFNFADAGAAVAPRYKFSGTMAAQFVSPGTSGLAVAGTAGAFRLSQNEWAAPPSATNPQLTNIVIF
ncbi:hypothetical protein H6F46_12075 [Limnothrix sp. FACHB-1083]|uniref:hypothetical protein n=1 Tax=unclassified Limnothrix TaxID=2632864 RepID=UPI00168081B8|nr:MULTISPECIES: hypothetical protein [unclassified Limnothrix]MBD2161428.1 hypothetical protein [Limnothrix sp. FACHB-1083]MBD2192061.1 hypothetical protein [Limnothrix sp. FACHB-1088]